jgi:hypothetical protein
MRTSGTSRTAPASSGSSPTTAGPGLRGGEAHWAATHVVLDGEVGRPPPGRAADAGPAPGHAAFTARARVGSALGPPGRARCSPVGSFPRLRLRILGACRIRSSAAAALTWPGSEGGENRIADAAGGLSACRSCRRLSPGLGLGVGISCRVYRPRRPRDSARIRASRGVPLRQDGHGPGGHMVPVPVRGGRLSDAAPAGGEFRSWSWRPSRAVAESAASFRKPVYERLLHLVDQHRAATGPEAG